MATASEPGSGPLPATNTVSADTKDVAGGPGGPALAQDVNGTKPMDTDAPATPTEPTPPSPQQTDSFGRILRKDVSPEKPVRSERIEKMRQRTIKAPWDSEVWNAYLQESLMRADDEGIRETYEDVLKQFPTAAKYWIAFAEFEQKHRQFDRMEAIFGRCLRNVPSVELWRFYLNYVRRSHTVANLPPDKKAEARATVLKAYEFVLQNVGCDKEAGHIWTEYIHYVKSGEAKKFLSEKSAGYMTARTAIRELKALLDPIEKAQKLWMARPPTWTDRELQMLVAWKRYIAWERSNPLRLEDKSIWISRVLYAYKSALLMLRYYPELYYEASSFLKEVNRSEEAAAMLRSGVETLPGSLLLTLSLAELEESRKKAAFWEHIAPIYDALIARLETQLTDVQARYDEERDKLIESLQKGDSGPGGAQDDWDGERREREREKNKERSREVESRVEEKRKKEVMDARRALTLVWIVYMRAARRAVNANAPRIVFTRARKTGHCTHHVYVAAARMEHFCNNDANVAGKIFEAGLKTFNPAEDPQATDFILNYLDFLINLNDDNNTRALFERALATLPADRAKPIWARLLAYESEHGDLAVVLKSEKRRAEAYPDEASNTLASLSTLAERWRVLGIDTVGEEELGVCAQQDLARKLPNLAGLPTSNAARSGGYSKPMASNQPEDRNGPRRFQNLESVHPERYPRPDLAKWAAYKPEEAVKKELKRPDESRDHHPPAPIVKDEKPVLQREEQGRLVPDAVARLMALLPPARAYNGPVLPIKDIIDLFRQIPLPTPPKPPVMVHLPPIGPVGATDGVHRPPQSRPGYSGPPPAQPQRFQGPPPAGRDMDRGRGRGRGRVHICA
ncbi:mRNA 3'-end-processing protein rna14 [Thoreauomyces humboldtii]|nr:mRNA 3'-end-processing protein rna14 [Thoreauomyces humboldtii]